MNLLKKLLSAAVTASCIFGAVSPVINVHATYESSVFDQAETIEFDTVYTNTVSRDVNGHVPDPIAYHFHLDTPSRIEIVTENDDHNVHPNLINSSHQTLNCDINNTTNVDYVNAGDYYIVYDFPMSWDDSSTYTLKVSATPIGVTYPIYEGDHTDNDKATAHIISPNSTIVGNVYGDDVQDWYCMNIPSKGKFNYTFTSDYESSPGNAVSSIRFFANDQELDHMDNATLNPGKLYILVSYEGHDPGTSYRFTTSFKPNQKPKKTSKRVTVPKAVLKKVKRAKSKKSLTVSVKSAKGVSGYEYAYATKKNFKGARSIRSKKTSVTLKKLNAKKKYYVHVRCYKKSGKKYYYGSYCNVKKA